MCTSFALSWLMMFQRSKVKHFRAYITRGKTFEVALEGRNRDLTVGQACDMIRDSFDIGNARPGIKIIVEHALKGGKFFVDEII